MTPREVDIAFVLEGIAGVAGLWALDVPAGKYRFAVKVVHGKAIAEAHYALLRVLSHEECATVLFFGTALPASIAPRTRALALTNADREAARARVPAVPSSFHESGPGLRTRADAPYSALIVSSDHELWEAVVSGLGIGASRLVEPNADLALQLAIPNAYDLILCPATTAFGRPRFLPRLARADAVVAANVVVVAENVHEAALARATMDTLHYFNVCLAKPLDPKMLLQQAQHGWVLAPFDFEIPVPPVRGSHRFPPHPPRPASTKLTRFDLVVDDDPGTHALARAMSDDAMEVIATENVWDATELMTARRPDLVVCSSAMRAAATPTYRLLWSIAPELKSRFVLLSSDRPPPSVREPHERLLLTRPISRTAIEAAVRRLSRDD